jgi:hypothetical protein
MPTLAQQAIAESLREEAAERARNGAPRTLAQQAIDQSVAEDWRDDPAADERWNAGVDFVMQQLCTVLAVDPKKITWDAATETLDGDVEAVIRNIMHTKYGEDWSPDATVSTS